MCLCSFDDYVKLIKLLWKWSQLLRVEITCQYTWNTDTQKFWKRDNDATTKLCCQFKTIKVFKNVKQWWNDKALSSVQDIESLYVIKHTKVLEMKRQQWWNDKDQIINHKTISFIKKEKIHRTQSSLCVRQRKFFICKTIWQEIERWSRRDWTLIQEEIETKMTSINTKFLTRDIELNQKNLFNRN